jgi:hypothetical protein
MNQKKHTLDDLFSDSGPFDEAEVVKAIHPFITIQKSSNNIFFKDSSMTTEQRILIYGLAKKLLKTKGLIETEMVTAAEVHNKTGIKKGSIDPAFKKLKENGLLVGKGDYEIPIPQIARILGMISRKPST